MIDENLKAFEEISKIARKNHGDETVDAIIDLADNEDSAMEQIYQLAKQKGPVKQNWLDKNLWGTMDTLTPLGKAISQFTTPITEAVRGPIQSFAQNIGENTSQTPPIDPLAELQDPLGAPSNRAGLGLLLTDISNAMGIKQAPLAQVDIENMPRTSQALTQLSNPAEGGAALLEASMGAKNFKMPGFNREVGLGARLGSFVDDAVNPLSTVEDVTGLKSRLADSTQFDSNLQNIAKEFYPSTLLDPLTSRTNRREMIKNYVTEAAKDRGLLNEILENGQLDYMVDMLEQNPDLIKPFNKKGALDLMEGPIQSQLNPETNRMSYRRAPEQGQIGKLAAQQGSIIEEIPDMYNVNKEDFLASALNELPGGLDESQRASAQKLIRESIQPVSRDPYKVQRILEGEEGLNYDPTMPNMDVYNEFIYNLNQENAAPFLNEQRKTGNVYKDQNSPFTDPRDVAARNLSGDALERAASQGLKQPMSELPSTSRELYQDTNRGISTRRNYRDLLSGARAEKDAFGRVVPQGDVERGIVSRVLGSADEFVVPAGHQIANYLQRQGVQYGNAAAKLAPISIQAYKIPRDSQQIMAEKDYIVSKIGKEMGPQYAADLQKIDDPDAIKLFLRNVELTRPDVFVKDPYSRMDGIIEHPILKQKALEDTIKNNNLSVLDKANTVEDLLINNRFLG